MLNILWKIKDYLLIKRSGLFDEKYYCLQYPDVKQAQVDPLWHFVSVGWKEGRHPSEKFNITQYISSYPEKQLANINPLVYYIKTSTQEDREKYLQSNSFDHQQAHVFYFIPYSLIMRKIKTLKLRLNNAGKYIEVYGLQEYLKKTINRIFSSKKHPFFDPKQGKLTTNNNKLFAEVYDDLLNVARSQNSDDFVEINEKKPRLHTQSVRIIPFYLPQFHPIPENDLWWGRGFTEWRNVSKAIPQFVGHYQPHLPGELGFYDLRVPEIMKRQIELAKDYGIYGFCFYYYWFNGKRLLDLPLKQFLSNDDIDFPFCLCWANENWTRRWDGQENDVLIFQDHTAESDLAFIRDLEPILRHKNYIKYDGRPVLLVYRPQIMPDPKKTILQWKRYCQEREVGDLFLIGAQTFGLNEPNEIGFDAMVEFPPHNIVIPEIQSQVETRMLNPNFRGKVFDYREASRFMEKMAPNKFKLFKTVMTSWDNTPRKPENGHVFINSNPEIYKSWLSKAIRFTQTNNPPGEGLVFINAWNEWAEGAHLEPDRKYGYAYLQATYEALRNSSTEKISEVLQTTTFNKTSDTAVILHVYYEDLFDEMTKWLENLGGDFDLYISIEASNEDLLERIQSIYPTARIFRFENRGRDIAPFVEIIRKISNLNYRYVLKIHTKKTPHRGDGDIWRHDMLTKLLGSKDIVKKIKTAIKNNQEIGYIGPQGHVLFIDSYWGENKELTTKLARTCGLLSGDDTVPRFTFVAGTMFWANPKALNILEKMNVCFTDFEEEPIEKDGMLPHAIERFLGLSARLLGLTVLEVSSKGVIAPPKKDAKYLFAEQTN